METRVNGRAIADYKDFDVRETGLAVPKAEPLYKLAVSNGYRPDDFVVDDYLFLYLPLYLLKGSEFKSIDRRNHSCDVTGALWQPDGRYFDGEDDIISLPLVFDAIDDCSIECWAKSPLDGDAVNMTLGFYKDSSNRHAVFLNRNFHIRIEARVGNVGKSAQTDYAPVADTWYHIVALMGTGGLKIYVDGTVGSITDTTTWTLSDIADMTEVQLGKYTVADGTAVFKGTIGEVRIYSRRLSVAEIAHNRNVTMWRYQ